MGSLLSDHFEVPEQINLADVLPIDANAALGDIVEPVEQLQQSGLAGAGRPDKSNRFPCRDAQADALDGPFAAVVAEANALELNIARDKLERSRPFLVLNRRLRLHDVQQPLSVDKVIAHALPELCEELQWRREL